MYVISVNTMRERERRREKKRNKEKNRKKEESIATGKQSIHV